MAPEIPEEVIVSRHGFRLRLDGDAAPWLEREVLPDLLRLEEREGATRIKRNNVRTVFRLPLDSGVLVVKRYHVRGPLEWLKYLVVPSRATAEWRAARGMRAAGIPTIEAVLSGEKRSAGILRDGCFASREIPEGTNFVHYVADHEEVRPDLLLRLSRLIRRFHDAGFTHGDLHGGNILVTGGPEAPVIHLLDLHTVKRKAGVGRGTRTRNLGKLLHSLTTVTNGPDRLRMLRAYEGDRPVLGDLRRLFGRLDARVRWLERRRLRSRAKRCLKRSSVFTHERHAGRLVYRRREVPADAALSAVEAHLKSCAGGGPEVLKDSRRSALSRQVLDGRPVVVKETRCAGLVDRLKNAVRRPRGLASWVNGNALPIHGFDTARPLALVLEGRRPFTGRSWLVMEDLGDRERLDLFVLRRYAGGLDRERLAEKLLLVRRFGEFVGRLHEGGVYHGDLKAVNVFTRLEENGEPAFILIDYDRVVFGRAVGRRRRIKNLAQLAASVAVLITKTDRLRFFRAYAFDADAADHPRAYAAGVLEACAKKIVVRMEPIE